MTEKVDRLKLKRRGQRITATKNREEVTSLLSAETLETLPLRRLKILHGLLEERHTLLKEMDKEIIELCPLEEVERETVESEEISGAMVDCIEQIKSVLQEKTRVDAHATLTARESEVDSARESKYVSPRDETLRINKSSKSGAPAVERTPSRSPSRAVDSSSDIVELPVTMKPKLPKIELPKFTGDVTKFCSQILGALREHCGP